MGDTGHVFVEREALRAADALSGGVGVAGRTEAAVELAADAPTDQIALQRGTIVLHRKHDWRLVLTPSGSTSNTKIGVESQAICGFVHSIHDRSF